VKGLIKGLHLVLNFYRNKTIIIIFPCEILERFLVGLGYEECKDQPQEVKGQQNENGIPKANPWQVLRVWTC
jgi:hypothetical protein